MRRKYINYVVILIAFIFAWSFFIFSDYCEENHIFYHDLLITISLLLLPIIIGVLYLIFEKYINSGQMSKAINTWIIIGVWISINTITGFFICDMVNSDKWIISQATGGWENFLNGIEYFIFPLFLVLIPIIIIAIWRLICFIYNKVKKIRMIKNNIVT